MTAGKVLIDGTAYDIKGGKTLIDGTAYDIKGGKTLIDGTGYNISFAPPREQTIQALMAQAVLINSAGRSGSSKGNVSLTLSSAGTYYVLSFCSGYMSVNKLVFSDNSCVKTVLKQTGTHNGHIYVTDAGVVDYSSNGSSANTVYGSTLVVLQFGGGYTDTEITDIFQSATYTRLAGRNSSTSGTTTASFSGTAEIFATYRSYVGFSTVTSSPKTITPIFGNYATNQSLLRWGSSTLGLSTDGSSNTSNCGCSIIQVS